MTELVLSFKSKHASGSMLASSFRLHEIKQMLAEYGEDISYVPGKKDYIVNIILSPTLSDEKDKEISILLEDYFDRNCRKLDTYHDFVKEMEYVNREG